MKIHEPRARARAKEIMDIDEQTAQRIRALAAESHLLEASVRRAILEQLLTQGTQVVGAREILDLAEGFAWVTNPGQAHGGRT
jgi:predicted polyphosphate/ATP-dependent NAD kinase